MTHRFPDADNNSFFVCFVLRRTRIQGDWTRIIIQSNEIELKCLKIVRILRNINKKSVSGLFRVAGHKYHGMEQVRYLQKGPDSLILKNGKFAPKL